MENPQNTGAKETIVLSCPNCEEDLSLDGAHQHSSSVPCPKCAFAVPVKISGKKATCAETSGLKTKVLGFLQGDNTPMILVGLILGIIVVAFFFPGSANPTQQPSIRENSQGNAQNMPLAAFDMSSKQSREDLQAAVARNPEDAGSLYRLGFALGDEGAWAEGLDCFRRFSKLKPQAHQGFLAQGIALNKLGQFTDSIAAYRSCIDLNPNCPEAYGAMGDSYYSLRNLKEACSSYRQAIALKPGFKEALYSLGGVSLELGDWNTTHQCTLELLPIDMVMGMQLISAYNAWADQQRAKGITNLPPPPRTK
jgi:Flp pilus assembly protein TadD